MVTSKFKHCFRLLIIILIMFPLALFAQVDDEFWFVAPDIAASHGDNPIFMRISAMDNETEINLRMPANPSFTPITQTIAPSTTLSINLTPWLNIIENTPADQVLNRGLLLVANNDVTAYYECAHTNNPGIFSLKGKNALGNEFYIVSQNNYRNQVGQESFEIVATEDNTTITITPSDDIIGHKAGESFVITLNRGETYSCRATSTLAERTLNGSYITSDKPIAVTWQDDSIYENGAYDIVGDQTIPTNILGVEYIAISGWANANEHIYVCGTEDNTDIYLNGSTTPAATINSSGLFSYQIPTTDNTVYLEASKPVYVMHLSGFNNEFGASILPQDSCTGSDQIGFNRTNNNTFALLILTRNGNQDSFVLNGSTTMITGADFDVVPGTNNEWVYSKNQYTTSEIPVGPNTISNTIGKFHLGVLHQTGASAEYGFFSDYSSLYLGADANICPGDSMILDGGSNMTSYEWYQLINSLWTLVDTNRYYTILDSGYYACVVSGNYCTLMDTIHIGMYPMATADLGPDTSICEGNTVTLDPGSYVSYLWNTGATTSAITVNSTGEYWVEVINNNGCVARDTVNVFVNPLPVPTITGSDSACSNNSEYLYTTQPGMSAYSWGISSGGTIISGLGTDTISVIWNDFGSHSVSINYINENGCTAENSTVFYVQVMPQAYSDAGSDENICEHYSHDFSNSSVQPSAVSYDSLLWTGGAGTFNDPRLLLPVYTPAPGELGDIPLSLISYGIQPCSNDTSTMILSILDGPEADFNYMPDDSLCVDEAINFSANSSTTIISWDWNFGDGNFTSGQNVTHAYAAAGIYDVSLVVVNDTSCSDTVTYTLEVHELPVADFTILPNDSVCLNTPMNFDAGSSTNILDWDWDLGDGNTTSGQNITHTYATPGNYLVFLYVYNENRISP